MPRVKGHYRKVGNKRIHVMGYMRHNPTTSVKRHYRKAHSRQAARVAGTKVKMHRRTY